MAQVIILTLRGTLEERDSLKAQAKLQGLCLNDFIRGCLGLNHRPNPPTHLERIEHGNSNHDGSGA